MFITASTTSGQRGGLLGRKGIASLENLGARAGVAHLAAHPDGNAVVLGIVHRHGRADGVAVAAVHALLFDHLHRRLAVHGRRADGARGAGGDQRRDFADLGQRVVLDLRRPCGGCPGWRCRSSAPRRTCSGSRPGRCAAWPGRFIVREVVVELVHHRLHDARGVGGRGVAVHPALRVDDVADASCRCRPPGIPAAARSFFSGSILSGSSSRNSTLLRLVKRR